MRNLFKPPSPTLANDLRTAYRGIMAATPLSRTHERELPYAVRDLSRLLTQDRSQIGKSYWINKRLLTAYVRYFLPWNLVRLAWLLPGLELGVKPGETILDLGSGPLTMPIALWIAKPEWREMSLTIVCNDVAPGPLGLGRDIFRQVAGESPWVIELDRGPIDKALRFFSGQASLITAANVLNEFKPSREAPLETRLAALARRIASRLAPAGRFLAVEPGTRLGGKLMALARHTAFAAHLVPEAPCPHHGPCPMLAERATGWCHFSHTADAAPKELAVLTASAKLEKHSLSLSCMLLRRAAEEESRRAAAHLPDFDEKDLFDEDEDGTPFEGEESLDSGGVNAWAVAYAAAEAQTAHASQSFIRIISDPIRLPDTPEPARYGCSAKGLVLAHGALHMPSGAAVAVRWPDGEKRDLKTGAIIVSVTPALPKAPPPSAPYNKSRAPREGGDRRKIGAPRKEGHQEKEKPPMKGGGLKKPGAPLPSRKDGGHAKLKVPRTSRRGNAQTKGPS